MNIISDGRGTGSRAEVDTVGRLSTLATSQSRVSDISIREGQAFLVASDFISLTTTGSFNGILYVKNTSDLDLFIGKIRTCSDTMGDVQLRILRNPTTGTLISDANLAAQDPMNFGSNETFGGLAYSASGDGKTVTDGTNESQFINHSPGHSIQDYEGALILPKGKALALVAKPSVALTFCAEIQCWFEGDE